MPVDTIPVTLAEGGSVVGAPSERRSGDRRSQGDGEGTELAVSRLTTSTSGVCGDMVGHLSVRWNGDGYTHLRAIRMKIKTKNLQEGQFGID